MSYKKYIFGLTGKVTSYLSVLSLIGFFICGTAFGAGMWEYAGSGIDQVSADVIACHPFIEKVIYAALGNSLYFTEDAGNSWKLIFTVPGSKRLINYIAIDKDNPSFIYLATSGGLYASFNEGKNWQQVFEGSNDNEDNITCIAQTKTMLYISTHSGVFVSVKGGRGWDDITHRHGISKVEFIIADSSNTDLLYIATEKGIHKSQDAGYSWKEIYAVISPNAEEVSQEEEVQEEEAEEPEEEFVKINSLSADPVDSSHIYACTSKGVLESHDTGKNWKYMTTLGLGPQEIKHLAVSGDKRKHIYAATFKGVFRYEESEDRWVELYKGHTFRDAKFLVFSASGDTLWAATGAGLFKMALLEKTVMSQPKQSPLRLEEGFNNEPTVQEVQRMAIRYAEVHPDKIQNWREQSKMKALFPELSVDYDRSVYGSSSGQFAVGPSDWGVSFKWNIGDLIWSADQTSIDVRSRLMVQLRDDMLDDMTRLYFERRRLQVDMQLNPPKDEKERYEKLLRLQELTAGIDALTGGWFSARLADKDKKSFNTNLHK